MPISPFPGQPKKIVRVCAKCGKTLHLKKERCPKCGADLTVPESIHEEIEKEPAWIDNLEGWVILGVFIIVLAVLIFSL